MANTELKTNAEKADKKIKVTNTYQRYARTDYEGECGEDVTAEDIAKHFYHPLFGGRNARVENGHFFVTKHND